MPSLPAGQVKRGQAIDLEGEIYVINTMGWVKPGKGPAYVQVKMKHVKTGKIIDKRFRSAETVETISVDRRRVQYSYDQGNDVVFMDPESFDQIEVPGDLVGDAKSFIGYGADVELQIVGGQVLGVIKIGRAHV